MAQVQSLRGTVIPALWYGHWCGRELCSPVSHTELVLHRQSTLLSGAGTYLCEVIGRAVEVRPK